MEQLYHAASGGSSSVPAEFCWPARRQTLSLNAKTHQPWANSMYVTGPTDRCLMRATAVLIGSVVAGAFLAACATAQEATPAESLQLQAIAEGCNHLFAHGKAIACVIGSGENSGTTTYYNTTPFVRAADGSYESKVVWSVVTRNKGAAPRVETGKQTDRIRWEGGKPVYVSEFPNRTTRPMDITQVGNGIIFRIRNPMNADISFFEYVRQADGQFMGVQHYLGLEAVVLWEEVEIPPELRQAPELDQS